MKRHLALLLILAAPLFLQGCGKDTNDKLIGPQLIVYPDRSTPKNTVLRMSMAVGNRDSVVTASVYADEYQGSSVDMTDPGSPTLEFVKSDEVRAVGTMAKSSSISSVEMEFYTPASWQELHYGADPSEWVTIQIPNFRIYVNDLTQGEYQVQAPSSGVTHIFEYTLKPTAPDPASPTDTTWTIVRWKESRIGL